MWLWYTTGGCGSEQGRGCGGYGGPPVVLVAGRDLFGFVPLRLEAAAYPVGTRLTHDCRGVGIPVFADAIDNLDHCRISDGVCVSYVFIISLA